MKILCTGDLHFGKRRNHLEPNELRKVELDIFSQIISIIKEEKIKYMLIIGDLFDSPDVSEDVVKQTYDQFDQLPDTKILICPGNHDPVELYEKYSWPSNVEVSNGWSKIALQKSLLIHGFGYNKDIERHFNEHCFQFEEGKLNIVAIHGLVDELGKNKSKKDYSRIVSFSTKHIIDWGADLVIMAHMPNPMVLSKDNKFYAAYTGIPINPYQHELVPRGVIILDITKTRTKICLKPLTCPQSIKIPAVIGKDYSHLAKNYCPVLVDEYKWELLKSDCLFGKTLNSQFNSLMGILFLL